MIFAGTEAALHNRSFFSGADAVAAEALGSIEGIVGAVDEVIGGQTVVVSGYADAAGDGERPGCREHGSCRDGAAELFCTLHAVARGTTGQDDEEFLTAVAADEVIGPHDFDEAFGRFAEDYITGGVAEGVIDVFEVVEVDHDHSHRKLIALGAAELLLQHGENRLTVPQAGEPIPESLFLESFLSVACCPGSKSEFGSGLGHRFLQLAVIFLEKTNAEPVKEKDEEKQEHDAEAAKARGLPVRRDHGDGKAFDRRIPEPTGLCLLEIELIVSGRQAVVENLIFSGLSPLRIGTEEAVTQPTGGAQRRNGELNLQIAGAWPDRHSLLEWDGCLVEAHLLDEGQEMFRLRIGARVDRGVPNQARQAEVVAMIRRGAGSGAEWCEDKGEDKEESEGEKKAREN